MTWNFDRLTSSAQGLIDKATQDPRASRVVKSAMQMKERVDDLGKRVSGLESMEKRVADLETRLAKLERASKPKPTAPARKPT